MIEVLKMEENVSEKYLSLINFDEIRDGYLDLEQTIIGLVAKYKKEPSKAMKDAIFDLCSVANRQIEIMETMFTALSSIYDAESIASYEGFLPRKKADLEKIKDKVIKISKSVESTTIKAVDKFYREFYPLQEEVYRLRGSSDLSADKKASMIDRITRVLLEYYPNLMYIFGEDLQQKQTWVISKVEEFNQFRGDIGLKPIAAISVENMPDLTQCEASILDSAYRYAYDSNASKEECVANILGYNARKLDLIRQEEVEKQAEKDAQEKADCVDQFETRSEDQFWNPNSQLSPEQAQAISDRYWNKFPQLEQQIYLTNDVNKIEEAIDLMTEYYPVLPYFFEGGTLDNNRAQIIEKLKEFVNRRASLTGRLSITKKIATDGVERDAEECERKIVGAMNTYHNLGSESTEQKNALLISIFNAYQSKPKKIYTGPEAPSAKDGCNDVNETHFPEDFFTASGYGGK